MSVLMFKKEIDAPKSDVFRAVADGKLFRSTGILDSTFKMQFEVGKPYSFAWKVGGKCEGRFLEIVPTDKAVFTWKSTECGDSATVDDTTVSVSLKEVGARTLLTLSHSDIKTEASRVDHSSGWTSSLDDFAVDLSASPKAAAPLKAECYA